MSYKLRCIGDTSGYLLFYGKGSRKLSTLARRDGNAFTTEPPRFTGKLREVKEQWGAWAAAKYHGIAPLVMPGEPAACDPEPIVDKAKPQITDDMTVYEVRQWEIDHAPTQEEADGWYRHVTVLEQKHAERDPSYVMHIYRRRGGPPVRQVKQ
jgi:hypothetical protein